MFTENENSFDAQKIDFESKQIMFVNEFQSESKYAGSTTSSNEITEEAEAQQNVADFKVEEQFESILKTKPRGKTKMQVDKYEVKCQKQLE